jgi:hypothetical protein
LVVGVALEVLVVEVLGAGVLVVAVAAAFELSLRFAVPRAAGLETTALRAAF